MKTINLNNFESMLDVETRQKAFKYFTEDRIKHIFNINGYEWHAVVDAYDEYVVSIKMKDEDIISMECFCSDENAICVHEATVLFHIKKEGAQIQSDDKEGFEKIKESLSFMPPHMLRYLVLKFAAENNSFRKFLKEYFKKQ